MIRKLAILVTVAFVPSVAFAAGASTNVPLPADTHVVGADAKVDSTVKADATAKPAKAAVVPHKAKSTKAKAKVDTKTDSKVDTKTEATKL